ncbi:MAG: hypothetical protein OEM00_13220 [Burkholderiaceae bacterium]|nr:hypothetical protein [Burkholderiaceae bacterium]
MQATDRSFIAQAQQQQQQPRTDLEKKSARPSPPQLIATDLLRHIGGGVVAPHPQW